MILLLFLLFYDSLPPLPDFSQILFPEPPFLIEQSEDSLILSAYAGNLYGGNGIFKIQRLNISGFYEQKIDWDTSKTGTIELSYSIPFPHLWIRPVLYSNLLERDNRYVLLSPQFDFSSTIPWAVIFGSVRTDLWQINNARYSEEKMKLEIIFDRMIYLPHFELSGIYTDNQLRPMFTGKLHIRNFHISIGSPIFYSFPSPNFLIQYLDPKLKLETMLKSGSIYRTLKDYLDPENPLKYEVPVAEESLKVGLSFNFTLDFFKHYCGLLAAYESWNTRLVPKEDFEINTAHNIQEVNLSLVLKNQLSNMKSAEIQNALYLSYNWTDTTIAFLSRYSIVDTFDVHLIPLQISIETKYFSKRDGFDRKLSNFILINPTVGLKYKFWKIFLRIYNITNEGNEVFDNYFLKQRQYAGGLAFNVRF